MSGICIQRHIIGNVFYSTFTNVFTALHGMQTRSSDENSVCLSVRPSVRPSISPSDKRVLCDKMVERSVQRVQTTASQ